NASRTKDRRRVDKKQDVDEAGNPQDQPQQRRHGLEALRRLVEIHDLDDGEVVVSAHHAAEYADDGKGKEPCLDGGEEYVELREEAGERRNACEREQKHAQEKRHGWMGARKPCKIADVLNVSTVAAHRQDYGEGAERHRHVDAHINEHALNAL